MLKIKFLFLKVVVHINIYNNHLALLVDCEFLVVVISPSSKTIILSAFLADETR